jgi:hypothetical protein
MTHKGYTKITVICSIAICAAQLCLSACSDSRIAINNRDWKALSKLLQRQFAAIGPVELDDDKIDAQLTALGLDAVQINDLIDLKNAYYLEYVEPRLDDTVTSGLGRLIEKKVCGKIRMKLKGEGYPPVAAYVITSYDLKTFQSQLENTYADDSIHIPEFPESYLNRALLYNNNDVISIDLDANYHYLVKPRYYIDHTWENKNLEVNSKGSLEMTLPTAQAVVFAIIAEKGIKERKYKVLWVLERRQ